MTDIRLDAKPLLKDLIETLEKLHPPTATDGKIDPEVARQTVSKINVFQKALCTYIEQASWMSSCTKESSSSVWIIYRLAQMQKAFHNLRESVTQSLETGRFESISLDGAGCEIECFLDFVVCSGRQPATDEAAILLLDQLINYADDMLGTEMGNLSQFNRIAMDAVVEGAVTEDEAYFLFLINCEYACLLNEVQQYRCDAQRQMKLAKKAA